MMENGERRHSLHQRSWWMISFSVFFVMSSAFYGIHLIYTSPPSSGSGVGVGDSPTMLRVGDDCHDSEILAAMEIPQQMVENPAATEDYGDPVYLQQVYEEKTNPAGTCVNSWDDMPENWKRVPEKLLDKPKFLNSGRPWTREEEELAKTAAEGGVSELIAFYNKTSARRIKKLSTDAANSMIDQCFGASNSPLMREAACAAAARVTVLVAEEYTSNEEDEKRCEEMHYKAKLLGYANYLTLQQQGDLAIKRTRNAMSRIVQASLDECGTISDYLEVEDWEKDLSNLSLARKEVRDYVHSSNVMTNLYTVPDLIVPEELDRFTARLWQFLKEYKYTNAFDVPNEKGYDDSEATHMGYLVTHIAYMPTGYGRHMQFVHDAPWIFYYIRENYYYAMDTGGLDLFAEFIDLLRSYGCTEDNDYMVRQGSRFLLDLYRKAGYRWMNHEKTSSDYDLIHMPWTAASGIARRQAEPIVPGSYGYAFYKAIERAQKSEKMNRHKK